MTVSEQFDLQNTTDIRNRGMELLALGHRADADVFAYLCAALGPVRAVQISNEMGSVWSEGRRDADPVELDMQCHPLIRVPF